MIKIECPNCDQPLEADEQEMTGVEFQCPSCHTLLLLDPSHQIRLAVSKPPPRVVAAQPAPPSPSSTIRYKNCRKCGTSFERHMAKCPHCGTLHLKAPAAHAATSAGAGTADNIEGSDESGKDSICVTCPNCSQNVTVTDKGDGETICPKCAETMVLSTPNAFAEIGHRIVSFILAAVLIPVGIGVWKWLTQDTRSSRSAGVVTVFEPRRSVVATDSIGGIRDSMSSRFPSDTVYSNPQGKGGQYVDPMHGFFQLQAPQDYQVRLRSDKSTCEVDVSDSVQSNTVVPRSWVEFNSDDGQIVVIARRTFSTLEHDIPQVLADLRRPSGVQIERTRSVTIDGVEAFEIIGVARGTQFVMVKYKKDSLDHVISLYCPAASFLKYWEEFRLVLETYRSMATGDQQDGVGSHGGGTLVAPLGRPAPADRRALALPADFPFQEMAAEMQSINLNVFVPMTLWSGLGGTRVCLLKNGDAVMGLGGAGLVAEKVGLVAIEEGAVEISGDQSVRNASRLPARISYKGAASIGSADRLWKGLLWRPEAFACYRDNQLLGVFDPKIRALRSRESDEAPDRLPAYEEWAGKYPPRLDSTADTTPAEPHSKSPTSMVESVGSMDPIVASRPRVAPSHVRLVAPALFPLFDRARKVGSFEVPAGATVRVLGVKGDLLVVEYNQRTNTIPLDGTDWHQRMSGQEAPHQ